MNIITDQEAIHDKAIDFLMGTDECQTAGEVFLTNMREYACNPITGTVGYVLDITIPSSLHSDGWQGLVFVPRTDDECNAIMWLAPVVTVDDAR